jgi:K(+)-stimulated pyrophosphate-energized sodium pump
MEYKAKPEYEKCVAISTKASIREMMLPGAIALITPLLVGFIFGPEVLGGLLAGVTVSGVLMGIFQSNAGGAWDNAKKSFEKGVMINGEMFYKKSEPHKASVTGDTVGDPFKDTSGPSMNILIKLSCLVGLTLAPILGHNAGHKHGDKPTAQQEQVVAPTETSTSSVVEVIALPGGEEARVTTTTTSRLADGREEKTTKSEVRALSAEEKARMNAPAPTK